MQNNYPSYIQKLNPTVQKKWQSAYKYAGGGSVGLVVANKWLSSHLVRQDTIARAKSHFTKIQFKVDTQELIKRSEDGDDYISAVLADTFDDILGENVPIELLQKYADTINSGGIIADIDHELYDELLNSGLSPEQIKKRLRGKSGILKAVKAVVDNGKLWVRGQIDKRYKNVLQKAKGLSIEAVLERNEDGKIVNGDFLGFSLIVNDTPANPRAQIYTD